MVIFIHLYEYHSRWVSRSSLVHLNRTDLGCYMSFHIFPMDIQTCPIELESFGYSMETLRFNWQENEAIQLNPYIVLPQFEIRGYKLKY